MVVTSIALLIVGATIMFNRAQPSEKEIAIAGVLVPIGKASDFRIRNKPFSMRRARCSNY